MVTDEDLTKEALAKPGAIVRRLRGTNDEHIAALPADALAPKRPTSLLEDDGPRPRRAKTRKTDRSTSSRSAAGAERSAEALIKGAHPAKPKPEGATAVRC